MTDFYHKADYPTPGSSPLAGDGTSGDAVLVGFNERKEQIDSVGHKNAVIIRFSQFAGVAIAGGVVDVLCRYAVPIAETNGTSGIYYAALAIGMVLGGLLAVPIGNGAAEHIEYSKKNALELNRIQSSRYQAEHHKRGGSRIDLP